MISIYDNLGRCAAAIQVIWQKRDNPVFLPRIPADTHAHELHDYLNKWLFETRLFSERDYAAAYETVTEASDPLAILGAIFNQ